MPWRPQVDDEVLHLQWQPSQRTWLVQGPSPLPALLRGCSIVAAAAPAAVVPSLGAPSPAIPHQPVVAVTIHVEVCVPVGAAVRGWNVEEAALAAQLQQQGGAQQAGGSSSGGSSSAPTALRVLAQVGNSYLATRVVETLLPGLTSPRAEGLETQYLVVSLEGCFEQWQGVRSVCFACILDAWRCIGAPQPSHALRNWELTPRPCKRACTCI